MKPKKLRNKKYFIHHLDELTTFAEDIACYLNQKKCPFYLLLTGDLGAGKTTLTKIILAKLGVKETVTSPTFVILNKYEIPDLTINHMDAYRLTDPQEWEMYQEEFTQSLNVIEWPENLPLDWTQIPHLKLTIRITDLDEREIDVE